MRTIVAIVVVVIAVVFIIIIIVVLARGFARKGKSDQQVEFNQSEWCSFVFV